MFADSLKDDIHTIKDQGHRGNRASLTIRIKHESKLGARATRAKTIVHAKARQGLNLALGRLTIS